MHECSTCGLTHEDAAPEEIPVPVPVENGPNENDVKIAEIEAKASIEREKIWTEQQEMALQAQNEELRGEIRGMREVLDRLVPSEPEPEPEPVVVPVPSPALEPEVAAPEETAPKKTTERKKGFF